MSLFKKIKPTSPGIRHQLKPEKELNKNIKLKFLIKGKKNSSGRNRSGRITVRHKGGGVKKKYRNIDFFRKKNSSSLVCSIEHDPFRNSFIAALFDKNDKKFSYVIASRGLKVGDQIESGYDGLISLGGSYPLSRMPLGAVIFNLSTNLNKPGQISRSAGTYSILKTKYKKNVILELSSKKIIKVCKTSFASLGQTSNDSYFLKQLGKAGCSRWINKRPSVRGVAMNPIDHPNGGGEGKQSGKGKNLWGKTNKPGKTKK